MSLESNIKKLCIVGAGIRGLGVLERLVSYGRQNKLTKPICVHLIDPSLEGPEQYDIRQPDYLLLNIVCGQVSLFPDAASAIGCPPTTGPSLYEWVRDRGLLLDEDGFTIGNKGRPIEAHDFLPRSLLGEYMVWFLELIKNQAGSFLDIVEHKAKAIDLLRVNNQLIVELSNGSSIDTDYLFLTIGQIPELIESDFGAGSNQYIFRPYPLPEQLECVNPGDTIAISGLGLTAVDAILTLTIGRGGKIETHAGLEYYVPSGKEPRIIAFSRSGLPYRSRPSIGAPLTYDPIVFTRFSIDALRAKRGVKLEYDVDVLPILFTEMRIAYRRAQYGRDFGWNKAQRLLEDMRDAFVAGHLESYLSELDSYDSVVFDPKFIYLESLFAINRNELDALKNAEAYQSWFKGWLRNDLEEARLGTSLSPFKAALEACREFRDIIRYAVDFGGLTSESSDRFFSFHAHTLDRIGVGPQKERTADLLALIQAGILSIPLGPNPNVSWDNTLSKWKLSSSALQFQFDVLADWMYRGSIIPHNALEGDSSIVGSMVRQGILRRQSPESSVNYAVDIDRQYHPISKLGKANDQIWIMGLLCEGVTFYNGYVTSPGKFVRSQYDADCAVGQIFSHMNNEVGNAKIE